jgi:hypothetical protein
MIQVFSTLRSPAERCLNAIANKVRAYAGFSSGGYSAIETTIRPKSIRSVQWASDKKKYPDLGAKRRIRKEDWDELQHAVDPVGLFALPDRIGSPGSADELVEWIEVEFSDGSKKSVAYNQGSTPPAIAKAMQKIKMIETNLPTQYREGTPTPKGKGWR